MSIEEPPAPKVSVVMPAYNQERFVEATARSVLAQTFPDLELIAVDDGSRDDTLARLRSIDDPRLHVLAQPNSGVSRARNAGIARARGRYVGFIDGDDVWLPEKVAHHVRLLDACPEIDLSFSRSRLIDEHGHDMGRGSKHVGSSIGFAELFVENVIGNGSAAIVRRSALDQAGHFDPELATLADHDQWLRLALLRPGNTAAIAEPLTLYRVHSGQMTCNWQQLVREWNMVRDKMRRLGREEIARVERRAEASMLRHLGYIAYEAGEYRRAARGLSTALTRAPLQVAADRRTWVLGAALAAQAALPRMLHRRLDAWARSARRRATRAAHLTPAPLAR